VLVAGCAIQPAMDGFPVEKVEVDTVTLTVWVADEPLQRQRGLSGLTELPRGIDGMLFEWESGARRFFNMADTLIPLDIWWFDLDGVLIGSTKMEPCLAPACPSYPSPGDVSRALETPAGEYDFPVGAVLSTG
jgi:uncharacterized membrane protein (UPF0127 family)